VKNGLYILACLAIPALWGVVATRVFDWFADKKKISPAPDSSNFWTYEI
jgi:hypothetical protein